MELERKNIMDDFKILMFYQMAVDWTPDITNARFHWDPIDGLGDCVLSKDPWDWTEED